MNTFNDPILQAGEAWKAQIAASQPQPAVAVEPEQTVADVENDPFSFTPEEAKQFAAKNAAEDEMRHEIDALECDNAELLEGVDSDIVLPLVPDGPLEDKLAALRKVNEALVETLNAQDDA